MKRPKKTRPIKFNDRKARKARAQRKRELREERWPKDSDPHDAE